MRFHVDLEHDASGRVTGSVTPEGRDAQPFDGWLALLRLLERRTEPNTQGRQEREDS